MNQHHLIRDQLVQWTLGEPLDVPLTALLDHLCQCASCKEFLRNVEETLAELPAVMPLQEPPVHLRSSVLQRIRETPSSAAILTSDETPGRAGVQPEERSHHRRPWRERIFPQPLVASLAVMVLVLGLGSGALLNGFLSKEQQLADLTARYQEETQWLDVATRILARGVSPQVRASLIPTGYEPDAVGEATMYYAYGDTYYLLLNVEGLSPQADYEVWLQTETHRMQLGTLTTSDEGSEVWVYRSTLGMVAGRLGVRQVGAPEPSAVVDL